MQYRTEEGPKVSTLSGQESAKILVVDDSREILEVLKKVLELSGYDVFTADRASKALKKLTVKVPDLIICDVMMPEQDGYQFHLEVKQNPDWCNIPFLFLTALNSDEEKRMGMASGCDDYLTKPFDPDDLVAVVRGKLTLARHREKMSTLKMEGFRRRIIHTLSHEFRTPLVSVNTGAELLLEQHKSLNDKQIARLLQSVWRGGQRLERLVDDFMLLQQIDLGHAAHTCELYRQRCPVLRIIETAVECFKESMGEGDNYMVETIGPVEDELCDSYISVYDVQLINVVQRLLSNAYKFGGQEGLITITFGVAHDNVFISVRDRGPGLQDNSRSKAYEPFTQINRETYEQQGCGLGLTIARYFTTINGGTLTLSQPEDGVGLEAMLLFPVTV